MSQTYPSPLVSHRRMDVLVHLLGIAFILIAGTVLIRNVAALGPGKMVLAVVVYVLCVFSSFLSSCLYHFAPWHSHRKLLRRIDHSAIYLSISGTFTPFFLLANTSWTLALFGLCWGLTVVAVYKKLTDHSVKSRWSTASYLGLGAIGLCALPDLTGTPPQTMWFALAGAGCFVIGTLFYARKQMPFRYAIWHCCVIIGDMFMFASIWMAVGA